MRLVKASPLVWLGLLGINSLTQSELGPSRRLRSLQTQQTKSIKRCWMQCVEQHMNAAQCRALIETELGGHSLPNHVIPHLTLQVRAKRTPRIYKKSYWFVGIPTDLNGNVACDVNNGIVRYPWKWDIPYNDCTVRVPLPEVNCLGMTASQCCASFKAAMVKAKIPLVDVHGKCLACHVHQQPLEPRVDSNNNNNNNNLDDDNNYSLEHVYYVDNQWNPISRTCEPVNLSTRQVQASDLQLMIDLKYQAAALDVILQRGKASCSELLTLRDRLQTLARTQSYEMRFIGNMLCGVCDDTGIGAVNPIQGRLRGTLMGLRDRFRSARIQSDTNTIVIYTDENSKVIEPPKIGGSIEHIDWNLSDECDDEPTCEPNTPPGTPLCENCAFNPANPDFACTGPPLGLRANQDQMHDYTIKLIEYDPNTVNAQGHKATKFVYEVCSSDANAIDHVTISWTGNCIIKGYGYLQDHHFIGQDYQVRQDPTTCLVGFRYNEPWERVVMNGPACASLLLYVDGKVSKSPTQAAIYIGYDSQGHGAIFKTYQIEGPDCSQCPSPKPSQCTPNSPPSEPIVPSAVFDPAQITCKSAPTATENALHNTGHAIMLKSVDSTKVTVGGQRHTRFTYTVCQNDTSVPIDHVALSWKGKCIIVNYSYKSTDFSGQAYGVGQDESTCLAGLQFMESWAHVPSPACRDLVLVVDGNVPHTTVVDAAIVYQNQYQTFRVEGPDCSAC